MVKNNGPAIPDETGGEAMGRELEEGLLGKRGRRSWDQQPLARSYEDPQRDKSLDAWLREHLSLQQSREVNTGEQYEAHMREGKRLYRRIQSSDAIPPLNFSTLEEIVQLLEGETDEQEG